MKIILAISDNPPHLPAGEVAIDTARDTVVVSDGNGGWREPNHSDYLTMRVKWMEAQDMIERAKRRERGQEKV